jgi:hypothetical protein
VVRCPLCGAILPCPWNKGVYSGFGVSAKKNTLGKMSSFALTVWDRLREKIYKGQHIDASCNGASMTELWPCKTFANHWLITLHACLACHRRSPCYVHVRLLHTCLFATSLCAFALALVRCASE